MYVFINNFYNKPNIGFDFNAKLYLLGFCFIAPLGFFFDSAYLALNYFDGHIIANIFIVSVFFILLSQVNTRLRKLMIVMVPMGLFGEVLFSPILGLHTYRVGYIPFYVPFAHAILYASGYIIYQSQWAKTHDKMMQKIFFVFFMSVFLGVGVIFNDILSLIFGFMFFYFGLRRKKWNTLYYYLASLALMGEIIGVNFGIWQYTDYFLGFVPTATLPVGVVYLYLGGDSAILRVMRYFDKKQILTPLDGNRPDENW